MALGASTLLAGFSRVVAFGVPTARAEAPFGKIDLIDLSTENPRISVAWRDGRMER